MSTSGQRIAIGGASGLIGSHLGAFLASKGYTIVRLVRGRAAVGPNEIAWDPAAGRLESTALEGIDAVVNLAGENVGAGRWSEERKRAIRESRVRSSGLLANALAGLARKPAVFVNASAIGYYGDRGEEVLTESSPPGTGFLAEVGREWEVAAAPARLAGVRTVIPRLGVVLSTSGGALAKMLPIFRKGLGGVIGAGHQYMSWIDLDDLLGVLAAAIERPDMEGVFNVVTSHPVTNREFVKTLASVLGRPAVVPMPATAVKIGFGEMGRELLLAGQRVFPERLEQLGFAFKYPRLADSLQHQLG